MKPRTMNNVSLRLPRGAPSASCAANMPRPPATVPLHRLVRGALIFVVVAIEFGWGMGMFASPAAEDSPRPWTPDLLRETAAWRFSEKDARIAVTPRGLRVEVPESGTYVGMLGTIVRPTSDPRILQLDCLATDFFRGKAWPTFLCYNPYSEARSFNFASGPTAADIYDVVTGEFVAHNIRDKSRLALPPDSAALYVVAPAGSALTRAARQILIGDVVVDCSVPKPVAKP
jgi:hypothetical protein